MKARNWVFTLNNPSLTEFEKILTDQNLKCLLGVREVGSTGTMHYQGLLQLKNPRAISTLRNLIPRAHWEIQRGSKKESYTYVLKTLDLEALSGTSVVILNDEGSPFNGAVDGPMESSLPRVIGQGFDGTFAELVAGLEGKKKRSLEERLQEIRTKIHAGASEFEISEEHFSEWVRYRQSFKAFRIMCEEPRSWKSKVIVIQGPTGTGKSKYCMEEHAEAYWKGRDQWWDGYEGQETVIIDEFYGWIPFDLLLRLLDRYPLQVEVKGGKVNFSAKLIIITTNKNPRMWYKDAYFPALARRVEEWWVFGTVFHSKYTNIEEARFIEEDGPQEGHLTLD